MAKQTDFTVSGTLTFAATEATFTAVSPAAKDFLARTLGQGAVGFTVPMSRVGDKLALFFEKGLVVTHLEADGKEYVQ